MTLVQTKDFTSDQIDLIKKTVAAGTSDLELALFLEVAKTSGLNPFQRQIYAVMRKTKQGPKMVIQTGIDGYRAIAARTGTHAGTTDAEFGPVKDGYPEWARVTVKRIVHGVVADFVATARWSEYVQTQDEWSNGQRTGKKTVTEMWARMPYTMLAKCAEALALRKGFPAELSGVYTAEEMMQADNGAPVTPEQAVTVLNRREQDVADVELEKNEDDEKIGTENAKWLEEKLAEYGIKAPLAFARKQDKELPALSELTRKRARQLVHIAKSMAEKKAAEQGDTAA